MLQDIIAIRNRKQPKSSSNSDSLQFDYKFWTDVEKLAKKQRENSLKALKEVSAHPDKPGVILRGALFQTALKQSNPRKTFDKDVFIAELIKRYPEIARWELVELFTKSVVDGSVSNTYTVEDLINDV